MSGYEKAIEVLLIWVRLVFLTRILAIAPIIYIPYSENQRRF